MEFALSEEQRILDESLRGFLGTRVPLERLRETAQRGAGFDESLWDGLCEQGIPGLLVPERFGGSGLGLLDAAIAAEALGHACAPAPFVASAVIAPLMLLAGGDAAQAAWLPRIAAGEVRTAVAFAGVAGTPDAHALKLDAGHLTGRVEGALDAGAATHLLVVLPNGRAGLVDRTAPGVKVELRPSLDRTRPLAAFAFDDSPVEMLDTSGEAALRVLDAGRVMLAADTLGAAQCMLDKAVAYARERVQFGRVIGSFQAVKHACAEMAAMLEPCRALVWYAAHAWDAVPDETRLTACHAKAHLGEVGREVSRLSTEVHGGMGFTDLLGLHFWFKRIAFDRQVLGGPERCRHEAAVVQGWAA